MYFPKPYFLNLIEEVWKSFFFLKELKVCLELFSFTKPDHTFDIVVQWFSKFKYEFMSQYYSVNCCIGRSLMV